MVQDQLRDRGIRDERVLTAMADVPRDHFLDPGRQSRAYADEAVPIDAGQTISQPWVVARMTELLAPAPGDRILELGTGSGYQGAILAALDLAGGVTIRTTDGSLGDPGGAPWDGIIVTAAAPSIPTELRDQLADGGRLVIPVGPRDHQILTLVVREGDTWRDTPHGAVVFVPLIGPGGFPEDDDQRSRRRRWF